MNRDLLRKRITESLLRLAMERGIYSAESFTPTGVQIHRATWRAHYFLLNRDSRPFVSIRGQKFSFRTPRVHLPF